MNSNDIDPRQGYSFHEACKMIPSPIGGRINIRTLHRWRAEGRFTAYRSGRYWFLLGSELQKLLPSAGMVEVPRSAVQQARATSSAIDRLRGLGLSV